MSQSRALDTVQVLPNELGDSPMEAAIRALCAFPPLHKEAADLTDGERIALCIAAGCKMDFRMEVKNGSPRLVATTVNPIGIVKVEGKFRVYEGQVEP
jgi:hypothetical protein